MVVVTPATRCLRGEGGSEAETWSRNVRHSSPLMRGVRSAALSRNVGVTGAAELDAAGGGLAEAEGVVAEGATAVAVLFAVFVEVEVAVEVEVEEGGEEEEGCGGRIEVVCVFNCV